MRGLFSWLVNFYVHKFWQGIFSHKLRVLPDFYYWWHPKTFCWMLIAKVNVCKNVKNEQFVLFSCFLYYSPLVYISCNHVLQYDTFMLFVCLFVWNENVLLMTIWLNHCEHLFLHFTHFIKFLNAQFCKLVDARK